MKSTFLGFLFLISTFSIAQNLVLNPSFEDYKNCPNYIGRFSSNVKDWSCPNFGSTDYFNLCSENIRKINHAGIQNPKSGNGFSGIYVFAAENYREYIQGSLKHTLEKDKVYQISFFISLSEYSTHAIKNIDILFTSMRLRKSSEEAINIKRLSKQAIRSNFVQIGSDNFYEEKEGWIKVSFEYKAYGFEKNFTIGNFEKNKKQVRTRVLSSGGKPFSYYYIDDVSVISKENEIVEENTIKNEEKVTFNEDEIYTFKNVLFDFDKAELLEVSVEELDKLYEHLTQNLNLNIEIYGHTDIIGLDARNEELSLQRAQAVANYLTSKGIEENRIKFFGFSSSKPVDSNKTEQGRSQNRRVEFKLIERNN